MILDVNSVTPEQLDEAARFFDEQGYVRLTGLKGAVTGGFEKALADAIDISVEQLQPMLDPHADASVFTQDMRRRLSKISTSPELAQTLLSSLSPILSTLIGPLVHVSGTYHGQFKGGTISDEFREISTYHNESKSDYMELHGAFRLHQDFTGASLPTSPSGLTLWVALNDCPESTLRLHPGSHRLGMFCHKMWKLDDPRLPSIGGPGIDFEARAGNGVLFNAMLMHGTGNLGKMRRVSCDLRFFPLCGFLPSEVHSLDPNPIQMLRERREAGLGDTLLTPILEQLAFLGDDVIEPRAALSPLNWANYVGEMMRGQPDAALPHMMNFINPDLLDDPPSVFTQKFHNREIHADRLEQVRDRLGATQVPQ